MKLSNQQINSFHERGLLTLDIGLDDSFIDNIVRQTTPLYDTVAFQNRHSGVRIQDGWKQIEEVRQLALDDRVLSSLQQLFDRRSLAFQTLNFPIGTGQSAHSDTLHFNSIPNGFMVGVWVALEEIDTDNGPLIYYPGSHKLPEYTMQSFDLEPSYDNYLLYEQEIQKVIAKNNLSPEIGIVKKGSIIIWHANLLHGGMAQQDLTRTRHSQVTHYFFEGCDYFTPMNSTPSKIQYRQPDWIPGVPWSEAKDSTLKFALLKKVYRKLRFMLLNIRRGQNPFD